MTDQSVGFNMAKKKEASKMNTQDLSKAKIQQAAFELFAQKGYAQTSVDSIAKRAKVSKGLIYHYFSGKEDLLKGIFSSLMKEGEILFEGKENLSPEQFLKRMVDYSIDYITKSLKMYRLILAISIQPEVVKGLKKELDVVKSKWLGQMTTTFKELGYPNPEAEAYLFSALFDGIGFAYIALGTDYPIEGVKALIEKKYNLSD